MKTGVKHKGLKIVVLLLVALMATLTFNQSVNLHTHKLIDGTMVTHAHPYNKTSDSAPIKNHHHTLTELLLLRHFEVLFLSVFIAIALLLVTYFTRCPALKPHHLQPHYLHTAPGRAPPFLS